MDDGSSSCVPVRLNIEAQVDNAYYPQPHVGGKPRIYVRTRPKSNLDSMSWEDLVNSTVQFDEKKGHRVWFSGKKTTSWCVPCGEYQFEVGTTIELVNENHHGDPVVTM